MINKLKYLYGSLLRVNEPVICPSCKSDENKLIDKKYFVTRLFECKSCNLLFRHPTEKNEASKEFYQSTYVETGDRLTTFLPDQNELEELKNNSFKTESDRSIDRIMPIIRSHFKNISEARILDYGCSWGYMSYQFKQTGMQVQSFEISKPRAQYGNDNFDLNIVSDENLIEGNIDIFFSSHVIEHVPSVSNMIQLAKKLLKKDGLFIAICPNGSFDYRVKNVSNFHTGWGQVHPNYLSDLYYKKCFENVPYYVGCYPFNYEKMNINSNEQFIDKMDLSGEMIVISKPNFII